MPDVAPWELRALATKVAERPNGGPLSAALVVALRSAAAQLEAVSPLAKAMEEVDRDANPVAVHKPEACCWPDWRMAHGAVFVARNGEDGDRGDWEKLLKVHGPTKLDAMYAALHADGKRIFYVNVLTWLEKHAGKKAAKAKEDW